MRITMRAMCQKRDELNKQEINNTQGNRSCKKKKRLRKFQRTWSPSFVIL